MKDLFINFLYKSKKPKMRLSKDQKGWNSSAWSEFLFIHISFLLDESPSLEYFF